MGVVPTDLFISPRYKCKVDLLPNYYINAFKFKIQNVVHKNVLFFHLRVQLLLSLDTCFWLCRMLLHQISSYTPKLWHTRARWMCITSYKKHPFKTQLAP